MKLGIGDLDILHHAPPIIRCRNVDSKEFLDGARDKGEICLEPAAILGMGREVINGTRDYRSGGGCARGHDLRERAGSIGVGVGPSVGKLEIKDRIDDVVLTRLVLALFEKIREVRLTLDPVRAAKLKRTSDRIGKDLVQEVHVLGRQIGNHPAESNRREGVRVLADNLDSPVGDERIDEVIGDLTDSGLVPSDGSGREETFQRTSQLGVFRRIAFVWLEEGLIGGADRPMMPSALENVRQSWRTFRMSS